MTGEMNRRKKGIHYVKYVSHGGTYLEAEAVCGWRYPTKTTTNILGVTCPECVRWLSYHIEGSNIKEATNAD